MGVSKVIVFGIKQALKITIGVALTIAVFFGVGWLVDWNAGRKTPMPSDSRFLPYADSLKKKDVFTGMRRKTEQPDSNHSFFETLKEQRREPAQIAQEQKQPPPAAQHKQPAAVPPAAQGAAAVEQKTPAVEQEKAPGEQTSAAPVTYTIQLGSFQNGDVAAAFSESLAGKGYPSHIVKIDVPGKGTVYRVRIGKYANIEEAQKVAVDLEKKEKVSAFITSK
jgi:cell division septation protein DedD